MNNSFAAFPHSRHLLPIQGKAGAHKLAYFPH